MNKVTITPRTADQDDIKHEHMGACETDAVRRSVCERIYLDRLNDNLQLCAALRAVYAIAGEDTQVRKIVEEVLNAHAA